MLDTMGRQVMSGFWQFPSRITEDDLVKVAEAYNNGISGVDFLDLHIRGAGENSFALGFKYLLPFGVDSHEVQFHQMRNLFLRRFGITNKPGDRLQWSVSNPTLIIRHTGL